MTTLIVVPKMPTRVTEGSLSLLDVIMTSDPDYFISVQVKSFGGSDHCLIRALFCARGVKSAWVKFRYACDYRKCSEETLHEVLSSIKWEDFVKFDDIIACVECFHHVIVEITDLVFPLWKFRIKKVSHEWAVSVEARSLRRKRDRAHKHNYHS